jgi:hypothetical protein
MSHMSHQDSQTFSKYQGLTVLVHNIISAGCSCATNKVQSLNHWPNNIHIKYHADCRLTTTERKIVTKILCLVTVNSKFNSSTIDQQKCRACEPKLVNRTTTTPNSPKTLSMCLKSRRRAHVPIIDKSNPT